MMKKIMYLLALFVLIAGCAQSGLEGYQNYDNDNFRISYPEDWQLKTLEGGIIAFASPRETAEDNFIENLNVIIFEAQPGVSLDDYISAGMEQLQQTIQGFKLIEIKETSFSGVPAKELSYESISELERLRFFQLFLIKNNKAYAVTFVGDAEKYDDYSGALNNMIKSFSIK